MTDAEAIRRLKQRIAEAQDDASDEDPDAQDELAMAEFCLVALADRAALVAPAESTYALEQRAEAFAAARRHMTGQPDDHGTGRRA